MISSPIHRSLFRLAPALTLAAALVLPGMVRAGVTLEGEHKTLDGSQLPFTYTVSIDKDKVKMVSSSSADNAFIYRADKGLFWMVDSKAKTYTEMTKKDIESMANTMDAAMKKMHEQMASMPPEQRAMMEKMMKENMPAQSKGKTTYKKTGSGKVGSWACDKYESYQDGVKKAEMCVVDSAPARILRRGFPGPQGHGQALREARQGHAEHDAPGRRRRRAQGCPGQDHDLRERQGQVGNLDQDREEGRPAGEPVRAARRLHQEDHGHAQGRGLIII